MNADEVATLLKYAREDEETLRKRIESITLSCTHLHANEKSAILPTESGCTCSACGQQFAKQGFTSKRKGVP